MSKQRPTEREAQVLRCVTRGYSDQEIAQALGVRPSTVRVHLKYLREKTGLQRRTQLAIYALKEKYITLKEIELTTNKNQGGEECLKKRKK